MAAPQQWLKVASNILAADLERRLEAIKPEALGIHIEPPVSDSTFACLKKHFSSWQYDLMVLPQLEPDAYVAEDLERLTCLHRATSLGLNYRLDTMLVSNWSVKGKVDLQFLKEFDRLERLMLRAPKKQPLTFPPDSAIWKSVKQLRLLDIDEGDLMVTQFCPSLEELVVTRLHHGSFKALGGNLRLKNLDVGGCLKLDFTGLENVSAGSVRFTEIVGQPKNLDAIGKIREVDSLRLIRIAAMTTLPKFAHGTPRKISLMEMRSLASIETLRGGTLNEFHLLSCPKLNTEALKVLGTLPDLTTVSCGPRRANALRPLLSPSVVLD